MMILFIFLSLCIIWTIGFFIWVLINEGEGELKLTDKFATDGVAFFKYISPTMRKMHRHCKKDSTAQGRWFHLFGVIFRFKKRAVLKHE